VRANVTTARALGDGEYELTGHKWFCSAPMCDAFLVLAQAEGGLSCFFLPRVLPDGSRNAFHIQRLKDKLGDRSNASSEIELEGAWARLVDEEGRGVRTIVEMVVHTRLDCVLGTAAAMRQAVEQATHHAAHRSAFGAPLIEQPLMQNVLADLCLESEAATVIALRLARAYDRRATDAREAAFASGFSSTSGAAAAAAPVEDVFLRPRPPRLPRRRFGFVGSVVSPASAAGGSGITGSGATSTGGWAAASAAETSDLRRRNQGKRKLLVGRHALHLFQCPRGSRERARSCR
jgi:hypothetical protein